MSYEPKPIKIMTEQELRDLIADQRGPDYHETIRLARIELHGRQSGKTALAKLRAASTGGKHE